MASDVAISNMALSHVGSDAVITSINPPDRTAEGGHCARFYSMARTELLESFPWTFAKTRVALSTVANPSTVWTRAYGLPSDVLTPQRVLQATALQDFVMWPFSSVVTADELRRWSERGSAAFEIEGTFTDNNAVLLTHEPDAVLLYARDVADSSKFTATFTSAFAYLLASYIAGPILRGLEGAKTAQTLRQIAYGMAARAMTQNANSSHEGSDYVPQSVMVR